MTDAKNGDLRIVSMTGNPSKYEIAALSSSISSWFLGILDNNPQGTNLVVDNTVENYRLMSSYVRSKDRFNGDPTLIKPIRSDSTWLLAHRVNGRK